MRRLAVALLHYPVLDRQGNTVTSAITNLDLHDIARTAHAFGAAAYYVVHPIGAQRELVERVRRHWVEGSGGRRIPDRIEPLRRLRAVASLDEALAQCDPSGQVELWTTSASSEGRSVPFSEARGQLMGPGRPVLMAFGTGWGLSAEVHDRAHLRIAPIEPVGAGGFNHFSVRAAVAIVLDRLLGARDIGGAA